MINWSIHYDYPNDIIYYENIDKGLNDYNSFLNYFVGKMEFIIFQKVR